MTELRMYRDWPNLVAMFLDQSGRLPDQPLTWVKRDGVWEPWTWRETERLARGLADGLHRQGVGKGDRIVLVSENRPEWWVSDLAILGNGGVTVPAYVTNTVDDHLHILSDSGAVGAIVSTAALAERVLAAAAQTSHVRFVVTMDTVAAAPPDGVTLLSWRDLAEAPLEHPDLMDRYARDRQRGDIASLTYTSGTGGAPKGVMLTDGGILHNCAGAHELLKLGDDDEVLFSFLPLSHSYERTAGQFLPMAEGAQVYFARSVDTILVDIAEVRPTYMTAVPRLYEAIRERILRDSTRKGGLQKVLLDATIRLGRKRYDRGGRLNPLDAAIDLVLDRLVRAKVRKRFGGRLKAFVSGGAPLNPEVGLFLHALGLTLCQGYGQTEASPVLSVNPPWKIKMHTAGPPLPGVELTTAPDGEILARGEMVMNGYWNDPEKTAETVVDGWLHTGDVGHLDDDGYLVITDRKKDLIVNAGGDNISPQRVEGMLALQAEIANSVVFGDRRPYVVAMINPAPDFVESWAKENGKTPDLTALRTDKEFMAALRAVVDRVNAGLSVIEKVRRFDIVDQPFSIDTGELTPTMKVRRHMIREHYQDRIDAMYRGAEA